MIPKSELEAWQRVLMLPGFSEGMVMPEDAREFMLRMIEQLLKQYTWADLYKEPEWTDQGGE